MNTPSTNVSPGLGGFLAFFLLAIALWLLMRNMNARLRRMSYREEAESTGSQPARGSAQPAEPDEEADRSTPATTDTGDEDEGDVDGGDRKPPSQG